MGGCGTDGLVLLLTEPASLGYHQNPISYLRGFNQHGTAVRTSLCIIIRTVHTTRCAAPRATRERFCVCVLVAGAYSACSRSRPGIYFWGLWACHLLSVSAE